MLHYLKQLKKVIDAAADEHVSVICRLYGVHIMQEKKDVDFMPFLEWNRMNHGNICKNGITDKIHACIKTRIKLIGATKQAL